MAKIGEAGGAGYHGKQISEQTVFTASVFGSQSCIFLSSAGGRVVPFLLKTRLRETVQKYFP